MHWKLINPNPAALAAVEADLDGGAFLTREGRIITAETLLAAELAGFLWDCDLQCWMQDGDLDTATYRPQTK